MSALRSMPIFWSEFFADTEHMSPDAAKAYLFLLGHAWVRGAKLPNDDKILARLARVSNKAWAHMRNEVLALWTLEEDGHFRQKRLSKVYDFVFRKVEDNRKNGSAGGKAKAAKTANENNKSVLANASQTPQQSKAKEESKEEAKEEGGRAAQCVELGKRITDLMDVTNDPRWLGNWSTVSVWLGQGFDAELDIWPSIVSMVERLRRTGRPMPGSLKYFSRGIEENHNARIKPGSSQAKSNGQEFVTVKKGTPQFAAWINYWRNNGRKTKYNETRDFLSVPSEYPPKREAA